MARDSLADSAIAAGTRLACRVEYDGARYHGWQSQPGRRVSTVQDCLEDALSSVAAARLRVHCAGRTDSGVHAHAQIIHFDAPSRRSARSWVAGGNANLPRDVRLHWAQPVEAGFHARFSATYRRYRYIVANMPVRPAVMLDKATWHRRALDAAAMHAAAQALLGERDFSAFRSAACQSVSPMRNVHRIAVSRRRDWVLLDIEANAFLHHMVRNIAGALLAVGDGRRELSWPDELLRGRDRTRGAATAPAAGLYLVAVGYPAAFSLPPTPPGPVFADLLA